jgi:hypothetical protein
MTGNLDTMPTVAVQMPKGEVPSLAFILVIVIEGWGAEHEQEQEHE